MNYKKIFALLNNKQENTMTSNIMQNISVYKLEIELWSSKEKLNKITPIFDPTPYIVIETNGTLIKAK